MGGSGKGRAMTLKGFGIGARLRGGVSLAVLAGAGLLVAAPAAAQDEAAPADETDGSGSDIVADGERSARKKERKRVVKGTRESGRVDVGGPRHFKQKTSVEIMYINITRASRPQ